MLARILLVSEGQVCVLAGFNAHTQRVQVSHRVSRCVYPTRDFQPDEEMLVTYKVGYS
jgi:hypothetical protein